MGRKGKKKVVKEAVEEKVEERVEETPAAKKELGEKNLDDFLRDWDNSSSSSSSCSSAPAAPALLLQRAVKKSKKAVKAAPTGEKTPTYQAMVKQVPFDLACSFS